MTVPVETPMPRPQRSRRWPFVLVALVVVLGVGLYVRMKTSAFKASAAPSSSGERVIPVPVTTVAKRDLPIVVDGLGSVTAFNTVTVKPQVDGRLDTIAFKEGQTVKKGDLLAQIDARPFAIQAQIAQANLARDQAVLANAKVVLARNLKLLGDGVGSQQGVDDARAEVAKDEAVILGDRAAIGNAALQLDFAKIKAPIDGITGVRLVDVGNVVHPGDPGGIVVITQIDPIAVIFTLPQDDLPRVSLAMKEGALRVEAFSRDGSTSIAVGELALVDNQINAATSTIKLKAIFPNPDRVLWPNQFVKARLSLGVKHDALVVPSTVVQRGPQGTYAYVVEGEKVALRPVEIAFTQGDFTVVRSGLSAGEKVVADGQNALKPGAKIVARPYGNAAAKSSAGASGSAGPGAPSGPSGKGSKGPPT